MPNYCRFTDRNKSGKLNENKIIFRKHTYINIYFSQMFDKHESAISDSNSKYSKFQIYTRGGEQFFIECRISS